METEIKVHIVIYDVYGDFTAYTPDFPGLIAIGNSKQEVVQKITRMLYRLALVEREKYKFQEN